VTLRGHLGRFDVAREERRVLRLEGPRLAAAARLERAPRAPAREEARVVELRKRAARRHALDQQALGEREPILGPGAPDEREAQTGTLRQQPGEGRELRRRVGRHLGAACREDALVEGDLAALALRKERAGCLERGGHRALDGRLERAGQDRADVRAGALLAVLERNRERDVAARSA
jgi:hypothetical protein